MEHNVSRRSFVTGTTLAGLAVAAGSIVNPAVAEEAAETGVDNVRKHAAQLNPQEPLPALSNTPTPNIFTPWQFGPFEMPNRIVKTAATFMQVSDRGIDAPLLLDYYRMLGASGAGLVFCDGFVDLFDHFKEALPGRTALQGVTDDQLRVFADTVHEGGAKLGYQLHTMGLAYSLYEPDPTQIFPTANCNQMTHEEVLDMIADHISTAVRLKNCGFDCVEINAAGENTGQYFMSRARNHRDDEYGPQSYENRTRFVCDIIRGIKEACGADFPVQVLFNGIEENDKDCGDSDLFATVEDTIEMCKLFEAAGADSLHVREGPCGMHVAEFAADLFFTGYGIEGTTSYGTQFDFKRHWNGKLRADHSGMGLMVDVAAEIKQAVGIPVGCVTFMDPARDPEYFDSVIADGKIDFMMMNRPLNVDPEYIHKLQEGRIDEIRPCTRCLHCHFDNNGNGDGEVTFGCRTYAPHPTHQITGQVPDSYFLEPADVPKKVMVAGAGPAGLEAAITAAKRGHEVTIYDKNAYTGGLLPFADYIKGEHEGLDRLNAFYARQLELLGVNVILGTEVDADLVATEAPDVVINATGGERVRSGMAGNEVTNVIGIDEIMGAEVSDDVLIYGSNAQAIDLGMFLLAQGKKITIVTPNDPQSFGGGHSYWVKCYTQPMMKALGVRFMSGTTILECCEGYVIAQNASGTEVQIPCNTVIEALDCLPQDIFGVEDAIAVGDAARPWNIKRSITTGYNAGATI